MDKGKIMKLWLLRNNTVRGYDTYDSCVVAAETEQEAIMIIPNDTSYSDSSTQWRNSSWCKQPEDVIVEYLGTTDRDISGVVIASFNAG